MVSGQVKLFETSLIKVKLEGTMAQFPNAVPPADRKAFQSAYAGNSEIEQIPVNGPGQAIETGMGVGTVNERVQESTAPHASLAI